MQTNGKRVLIGPDGQPLRSEERGGVDQALLDPQLNGRDVAAKTLFSQVSSYLSALGGTRLPALQRARDPFSNHAWVFAAAMAIAITASQAPFGVWRETESAEEARRRALLRAGRKWRGARAGSERRAVQRHLQASIARRIRSKAVERDVDHPLVSVLWRPNPLQDGTQLFQTTHLWLAVRGEVFWVLTDEDGMPPAPGVPPARIWALGPDLFTPVHADGIDTGELVGWQCDLPRWMPAAARLPRRVVFALSDLVQFKYPNPNDPRRGMSRIAAAAAGIEIDLLVKTHNRALLTNQAVPKGILTYDGDLDPKDEAAFRAKWKDQFEGAERAARTAFLANGFKFLPVALSPQDMEFLEQQKLDREEQLAVMGCPPSILGVTEFTNYATALGQDKTFWEKTIIPLLRLEECAIDGTIFYSETDNVFGAFDYTGVEALRVGIEDKIKMAKELSGETLHVPPRTAFEVVGLDVPEYEGDEVALVGALATPLEQALAEPEAEPAPGPLPIEDDPDVNADEDEEQEVAAAAGRAPAIRTSKARKGRNARKWKDFVKVQVAIEKKYKGAYRSWAANEKVATLKRFDKALGKKDITLDLTTVFPELKLSIDELKKLWRPTYFAALESTFDLTSEEIGVPVFEIDDERFLAFFEAHETKFASQTPTTVLRNLRRTLTDGVKAGETIQQLRVRVGQVYDVARSSSKTLTVARTTSASFMNGVRREMFEAQGFEKREWSNAGDEVVRPDHVTFGEAGPQPRGFNYLDLVGGGGTLEYPGDLRAPPKQVVSCRCLEIPIE